MVELRDGSVIAQLGVTDMRLPIQYAFSYPGALGRRRCRRSTSRGSAPLEFLPPDLDRFPCLRLAYEALEQGGAWPIVLNAANEVAVEAFLGGRLAFPAIPRVIERALDAADRGRRARLASLADVRGDRRLGARRFRPKPSVRYHRRSCNGSKFMSSLARPDARSRFSSSSACSIFVHELGHFLVARWYGVRVHHVLAGLRPEAAQVPPRRHRVLHQRRPARRLREAGRRDGRGRAAPARPTSSCPRASGCGSRSTSPARS